MPHVIISFAESPTPLFENCMEVLRKNTLNIQNRHTDMLLAFLLNAIIASLIESVSKIEEELEDMKETLLDMHTDPCSTGSFIQLKRKNTFSSAKTANR